MHMLAKLRKAPNGLGFGIVSMTQANLWMFLEVRMEMKRPRSKMLTGAMRANKGRAR